MRGTTGRRCERRDDEPRWEPSGSGEHPPGPALAVGLLALALAGCQGADAVERTPDARLGETPVEAAGMAAPEPGVAGIPFDPATAREGDRVGPLVVDEVEAEPNLVDSTFVGSARFRGEIELSGLTVPHPDESLRETTVCFEADAASAAWLPRWRGDERRPWLCFENQLDARGALRGPVAGIPATIVVDRFTIRRDLTDAVNSARLLGAVTG